MRAFLAVSAAATSAPHMGTVGQLAGAASTLMGGVGGIGTAQRTDDGWIAWSTPEQDDRIAPDGGFTVRLTKSVRTRTEDIGATALGGLLKDGASVDGDGLAALLPPAAAAHCAGAGAPIVLAGDWLGMRQLFWWQGDGVAGLSTSARALAALAGSALNTPALGVQSLMGWQVGLETIFQGVSKLAPGCIAVLQRGRVTIRRYVDQSMALDGDPVSLGAAVDEMALILRDMHTAYLTEHPDTVLQLTGGQDSRLLLGGVPPELRTGLRALTLDVHGGVESTIATRLSALCGLAHYVHWLDDQPPVDASSAHRLTLDAASALDCMASPVALAPLALIESSLDQGHRLSGAGGETARGFYYPGQPTRATTSGRLVRRLADWRLFTNEAVAVEALEPDFATAARVAANAAVDACFAEYSADWLRATDEFYLWQRMQRWAGAHGSASAVDRFYINPLLDRRFIQLALAPAPAEKRDSQLTGQLLRRLDPQLAAIRLDSGLIPARLGRRGPMTRVVAARVTARKAIGKVRQRVHGTRPAQLGAAEMAALAVEHWRSAPDTVEPLRRTGLVRTAWLDELLDGRRAAQPSTVAFLVNLLVATEPVSTSPGLVNNVQPLS
jgi:asparagine synthase (glutamine-hydrolysing)